MSKVKLTVWTSEAVAVAIRGQAALAGLTVSEYLRVRLKEIVEDHRATLAMDLVEARLERALRESIHTMGERLSVVLSRAAVEAGTARRNSAALLQAAYPGEAKRLIYDHWREAAESVRKPVRELAEVLGDAEAG